jgi:hypothetical protein
VRRSRLLPAAAALALAARSTAEPPSRERDDRPAIRVPESSLQLLLRNRDALGLDGGQVLTLELKDAELQRRTQALLADVTARPERGRGPASLDDRGGPRGAAWARPRAA